MKKSIQYYMKFVLISVIFIGCSFTTYYFLSKNSNNLDPNEISPKKLPQLNLTLDASSEITTEIYENSSFSIFSSNSLGLNLGSCVDLIAPKNIAQAFFVNSTGMIESIFINGTFANCSLQISIYNATWNGTHNLPQDFLFQKIYTNSMKSSWNLSLDPLKTMNNTFFLVMEALSGRYTFHISSLSSDSFYIPYIWEDNTSSFQWIENDSYISDLQILWSHNAKNVLTDTIIEKCAGFFCGIYLNQSINESLTPYSYTRQSKILSVLSRNAEIFDSDQTIFDFSSIHNNTFVLNRYSFLNYTSWVGKLIEFENKGYFVIQNIAENETKVKIDVCNGILYENDLIISIIFEDYVKLDYGFPSFSIYDIGLTPIQWNLYIANISKNDNTNSVFVNYDPSNTSSIHYNYETWVGKYLYFDYFPYYITKVDFLSEFKQLEIFLSSSPVAQTYLSHLNSNISVQIIQLESPPSLQLNLQVNNSIYVGPEIGIVTYDQLTLGNNKLNYFYDNDFSTALLLETNNSYIINITGIKIFKTAELKWDSTFGFKYSWNQLAVIQFLVNDKLYEINLSSKK